MKRLFLLAFLCLQALFMSADVLKCRVTDADSGEPLEGAKVQIFQQLMNQHAYWVNQNTDSCGVCLWSVGSMSKVTIEVNYFGYEPQKKQFNCAGGSKDTLLIDMKMRMTDEMLKEVLVTAKARRFVMKGDTVVFNPEAFNMEDGARVAELLQKLPGVSVKDGKLYFMEKEVHLKTNGRNVADDFLTGMLPAEAVQDIKAYEKKSELAEVSGMNDGKEEQVLDITIKPGFMDKWYGQVKASAYASKNYRASANLHYLTDNNPINLYVRASDNAERTVGVYGDNDYGWGGMPQQQQYGKFSYKHGWKPKNVTSSYDEDNWSVSSTPEHLDTHQNSWTNTENFISGQPSSFSNSHSYNSSHSLNLPLHVGTFLHFGPKTWLSISADGGYNRNEDQSKSNQETYHGDRYADAPKQLVNSSSSERLGRTDKGTLRTDMRLTHVLERGDFYVSWSTNYTHSKGRSDNFADYNYHDLGTSERLVQNEQSTGNFFQTIFDTKINYQIVPKKVKLGMGYWMDYYRNANKSTLLRNGEYDFANSYDRCKMYLVNEPRFEAEADLGTLWMHTMLKIQNVEEHLDYQRGKLDTLARRNTWFPRPMFEFKWNSTKTSELRGNISWEYHVADMLDGSGYVDDTNPLNITMGNPNLKPSSDLDSELSYNMMFAKGQQMLSTKVGYWRVFDPVTHMSAYNATTGAYISSVTNVDDRQTWFANISYDRALGELFRMQNYTNYSHGREYGISTRMDISDPLEQFHQTRNSIYERLRVSFETKEWELTATGVLDYAGIKYSDPTINGQNQFYYSAALDAKYRLKHWTFNIYGELQGRSGYLSDIMNRKRIGLNASVTWKMLKNKGQLTLFAKDILNQFDETSSQHTPTMRSETRKETFHRYLALTFTYNFDAKAKKMRGK